MSSEGGGSGEGARAPPPGKPEGERTLVDAEDWKDAPGQKTICEYHKNGLPNGVCETREVDDLDSFADYWKGRNGGTLRSEYHKEGAPYIEDLSDWDGHRARAGSAGEGRPEEAAGKEPGRGPAPGGAPKTPPREREAQGTGRRSRPPMERLIDVPSVELAAYALFRSFVGRGIRIPLKREGVIDMDIIVKDKDVVLNTNELSLELPRLAIWKFVFAYKGEPVVEYGRGVRNNIKVHRWRMFKLLLRLWWRGRQKPKQVEKDR